MVLQTVKLGQLQGPHALWVVVPVLLLSLATPAFIMALLANLSGWRKLAARYPRVEAGPAAASGSMGSIRFIPGGGYNNCVIWRDDQTYLHLRLWPWLGVFHAPLSVPWEAIGIRERGRRWVGVEIDGVRWSLPAPMLTGELARRELLAEAAT
jgi:hypothetical protein